MVETHIPTLASDQSPSIQSLLAYPPTTPHLNPFNLAICASSSGRGVYTTTPISADTTIEISPVLLFPPAEYAQHGSKTQLDGYTFVWKRTEAGAVMALALGLGSLFNHSGTPNVKWMLDRETHSIRYSTVRGVEAGEELTISYGTGRMWWEPEMTLEEKGKIEAERRRGEDAGAEAMMMGLIGLDDEAEETEVAEQSVEEALREKPVVNGIESHPIPGPSRYPPIYRLTAALDPVTLPLTTRDAWVIDIPPTSASLAVKFLQRHAATLQNRDDGLHSTRHLRSFRTTPTSPAGARTQFLLCLEPAYPDRTDLVEWLIREGTSIFGPTPQPYLAPVPAIAAPTRERLAEWQAVWPCIVRTNAKELLPGNAGPVLLVDRKADEQLWEDQTRLRWVVNRFKRVTALARHAQGQGRGLGSAVHVTHPFDVARRFEGESWEEREQCDWSKLTGIGAPVVGRVPAAREEEVHKSLISTLTMTDAEWTTFNSTTRSPFTASTGAGVIEVDALDRRLDRRNPLKHAVVEAVARVSVLRAIDRSPSPASNPTAAPEAAVAANGSDYLLTHLSLFSLYEPCIYCCMALVHSRVSEVFFLLPSPGRGGCCGAALGDVGKCDGGGDGGVVALQEQKGLNHAFSVWRWMADNLAGERVEDLAKEFDLGSLDP
ncbi:SET domain protein [Kalmanozyma brasiliensis GHG001]|uniref:SET domain-containing protein n=1 Tax=Kalmanozyma brasiliensis (strain GHG001) TaxID=1365824 RepID=V5ENM6_KALBG|nr:SET domain protein [Kalmanozyma brasiliensis GHG001]EST06690.1 SET domain protein [Kalmanozyma brasiliensis GHG001]